MKEWLEYAISAFLASAIVGLLLTPAIRRLAIRIGLVDNPDGRRKIHRKPIPVAGGIVVLLTTFSVLIGIGVLSPEWVETLGPRLPKFIGLAIASWLIAVLGVADDFSSLRGRHKLLGQILAVSIVIFSGVIIHNITILNWTIDLGYFAVPITAFWLLGAINSLNLIDGLDGLLGSVASIICASLAVLALLNGHYHVATVAAAIAGALLGFLFYNFPPASIFLGDCGSMLIGLNVGVLAIESTLKGPATVALALPAALLVIPILDTSAAIVRRKLTGRSIYTTDRGHFHHVLLGRGLSNRKILMLTGSLSVLASTGALLSMIWNTELLAMLSFAIVIGVLLVTRMFGHAEFLLIKDRILSTLFTLRYGRVGGQVHESSVHLQGSADWNDLWKHMIKDTEDLNLTLVRLDVNAPAFQEGFHARWGRVCPQEAENPSFWTVLLPLTCQSHAIGRLEIRGMHDSQTISDKLLVVARVVENLEHMMLRLTESKAPSTLDVNTMRETVDLQSVPMS